MTHQRTRRLRSLGIILTVALVGGAGVQLVATAPAAHAFEEHHVDFNGDGYADLVIGAAGKAVDNMPQAGEITVMYGSSTGLKPTTSVVFNEDTPGMPEASHARDFWGYVHAVGDFNGDGYDDLAIAGEDTVSTERNAGTVTILWGSASGLTTQHAVLYTGQTALSAASHPYSFFGQGLAAGDFDGDGFADLAIGAPGVSHGAQSTGLILLLRGSLSGLINKGTILEQGTNGVPGTRENDDFFGDTILAADLDHDGRADLIVGDSQEDVGNLANAGVVYRFWGSPTGLTAHNAIVAVGNATAGRLLGYWLAVVPGTNKVYADAPGATENNVSDVDQIQVDHAAGSNPAVVTRYRDTNPDDGLGVGMVVGTFGGIYHDALVMGAPGQNEAAGRIQIVDDNGVSHYVDQNTPGVADQNEVGDQFGTQVVAEDFNHDGYDDLVVSVPFEDLGSITNAGSMYVFYGSSSGIHWDAGHLVTQETPGVPGSSQPHDDWGWV